MVTEVARAKVNLCLHVTGRRDNRMHRLDSIVVFPEIGDEVSAEIADNLTLEINGPFGGDISGDNLVLAAARLMGVNAALRLTKNLPIASGIGGGSADAAACIRALSKLTGTARPSIADVAILGADIPVCLSQTSMRMRGIGEILSSVPPLPRFWILLVNAGQGVDTGQVFSKMENCENPPLNIPSEFSDFGGFVQFLASQRNDMQSAALKICPVIKEVLSAISATQDCALSRMSGSGGTCFGLYASESAAKAAVAQIQSTYPDWWIKAAIV